MDQKKEAVLFSAIIDIIGINPFVYVPKPILEDLFDAVGKDKGPIPVKGRINGKEYTQTLVKFSGEWRLYINTKMLPRSPKRIGEEIEISVEFDPEDRTIHPHPKLVQALKENPQAAAVFEQLIPSIQHEIVRYIANLKTEASVDRNVLKAMNFLLGKERFIGRDGIKTE
ncbi:hypothetical protein D3C87_96050 [compost metagenome]